MKQIFLEVIQNINTDLTNLEVPKRPQILLNAELTALKHSRRNPFIVLNQLINAVLVSLWTKIITYEKVADN